MSTDEVAKAQAEEYLAELPDEEFAAVLKRVRPPAGSVPSEGRAIDRPNASPAQHFESFLNQQLNGGQIL